MSNKIVSTTYRSVIDDVISNVRQDFEEMGIEKEVLEELQRLWEGRLIATGVADFDDAVAPPTKPTKKEAKPDVNAEEKKPQVDGSGEGESSSSPNKASRHDNSSDATADRPVDRDDRADDENSSPVKAGDKRKQPEKNSDEIGSDLDDSDDDLDGEDNDNGVDADTVLCLYDKVQRVKNKWKCVLRDGVANIDGKDYLFSRCNTEFEW
ncbi:unnamed protein product [Sympodiomycopsis kandeliae]